MKLWDMRRMLDPKDDKMKKAARLPHWCPSYFVGITCLCVCVCGRLRALLVRARFLTSVSCVPRVCALGRAWADTAVPSWALLVWVFMFVVQMFCLLPVRAQATSFPGTICSLTRQRRRVSWRTPL